MACTHPPFLLRFVLSVMAAIAPATAYGAAAMMIWPVDPVIDGKQQAQAIWLQNQGATPAVMQIRIFGWRQVDGKDQYEEQQDIESSPPIATIAPGARQMIRLTAPFARRQAGEASYRIIIDEVPVPSAEGTPSTGVRFQMRYSVPLFTYSAHVDAGPAVKPHLRCTIIRREGEKLVRLDNLGTAHARLLDIAFEGRTGHKPLKDARLSYVLAGSAMTWPLPDGVGEHDKLFAADRAGKRHELTSCVEG